MTAGASPSFTVSAGGAAPRSAYQWRFNGVALTNNAHIAGAQTNVLIITNVTAADVGTYQVTVTNAAGLTNVSATLALTGSTRTNPVITWTNPAAITYGTALGSSQLAATANVPGAFVYTPAAGTVLNAGTNTLTTVFTPTDTVDYNSATDAVSLVILPASLRVSASNAFRLYGQNNPAFGGTITGIQNADNITASYITAATTNSPAGTYPITPALVDPNGKLVNYTVVTNNGLLTVGKATPLITWAAPSSITYGTVLSGVQLNASANVPGSLLYNPAAGTLLNAGTNTLTTVFTPTDTVDYNSATDAVSLVILPASLTVAASNAFRLYGQTNPASGGIITGIQNADNITATYATVATTNSPVGTYPITPALVDPNGKLVNYTVATNNGLLTVGKAEPLLTWAAPSSITYGTVLSGAQLDASANVPGSLLYNPAAGTVLNAGTNTLTTVFTPTDTVDYNSATDAVSLVILPASLTVSASNAFRLYGQNNPAFGGIITGIQNADNITATYVTVATTNSPAGTYPITPALVDPNGKLVNYTVATNNGLLTVGKAEPLLTWAAPSSITYGTVLSGVQLNASANVPGSLLYNPAAGTVLNAGTNTLTTVFTPTDTVDYNSATDAVSLVILPASLTVTGSNAFRLYGQTNPAFGGTITGIQNADDITATYGTEATNDSPVGTYPITPSLIDPNGKLVNYTVVTNNGLLTVGKATPLITWGEPSTITYGTALGGVQLNASVNAPGSLLYNPALGTVLNAGTNTLTTVFTPTDTVDYNSATDAVSLVVLPASLTVAANDAWRAYGASNPVFAVTYSGFVNGESLTNSDVAGAPLLATAADTDSPIGPYAISNSAGSLTSTNYTFVLTDGTLTVTQAILMITANNGTKVYGQTKTFEGTEFTADGLIDTDRVTSVTLTSVGAPGTAAVGQYPILASGATGTGLENYSLNYMDGSLTVTPGTPVMISDMSLLSNGTIKLTFTGGDAGLSYRVQASPDVSNPMWNDLSTNVAGTNGLPSFTDVSATNQGARFYRTVTP